MPYMRRYSHDSRNAALAAWAAWEQGKFWDMHDLLFEKAPELDRPNLDGLANQLGLDMARYNKVMEEASRLVDEKVPLSELPNLSELHENLDKVHELDIWSTPTTIINGTIIKGAQPIENYRKVIDEALGRSSRQPWGPTLLNTISIILTPASALAQSGEFGRGKVPLYVKVPDAKPTNEPKVGEEAPDFRLPSVDDTWISLSDYRGSKNVLLSFMPAAFTPV